MPIDMKFMSCRKAEGKHAGHDVWGPVEPPTRLGIHGRNVAVDFDLCNGDGECIKICPVTVFELLDTPGHPASEKKSDPAKESSCIFCMACEAQCPHQAIRITRPGEEPVVPSYYLVCPCA